MIPHPRIVPRRQRSSSPLEGANAAGLAGSRYSEAFKKKVAVGQSELSRKLLPPCARFYYRHRSRSWSSFLEPDNSKQNSKRCRFRELIRVFATPSSNIDVVLSGDSVPLSDLENGWATFPTRLAKYFKTTRDVHLLEQEAPPRALVFLQRTAFGEGRWSTLSLKLSRSDVVHCWYWGTCCSEGEC